MASPNTARKVAVPMNETQDVNVVVQFKIKNCAAPEDFESMGGTYQLVEYLIKEEGLMGIVADDFKVLQISIAGDGDGECCPGCFATITLDNAGGYRTFCNKCVESFPELPSEGEGFVIGGIYPDFKWVEA